MAGVDWESVTEATSGAVGALVSNTVLYPLDTCKTKYQAEVRSHGRQKYRFTCFLFFFCSFDLILVSIQFYGLEFDLHIPDQKVKMMRFVY